MNILPSALLALISICLPLANALALTDQDPPTANLVLETFAPMRYTWQPVSGQWDATNGTYGNNSAGATAITTLTEYRGVNPESPPGPTLGYDDYIVRARLRNSGTTDAHLVGLIYAYQDSQNYYEVVVSALGTVTMRTVMNGVAVEEAPSVHANVPRNTWFSVEVTWTQGVATLKIDGISLYTGISQPEFTDGKVALVTHGAIGRFDNVFVGVPIGYPPFLETFDTPSVADVSAISGQWSVTDRTFRSNTVQQTTMAFALFQTGIDFSFDETADYTFRARILNPYAGAGNLVGIVFNYESANQYVEVVFSPTGVATMTHIDDGVRRTLATANYSGGGHKVPFEVTLENEPNFVSVLVNGVSIFGNVPDANRNIYPSGRVGLITHWAPGRFDNVQFDYGVFQRCPLSFDEPLPSNAVIGGTWDTNGGTLNSTAVGQNDTVNFSVNFTCGGNARGEDVGTDQIYSARLLNQYSAAGNLVGLVYNYQDPRNPNNLYGGDYFEVVFSPTGVMQLNKFIQGVRYPVRTLTHSIPRNTWFDVQVIRTGILTEVKLNGVTVVSQLPQGEIRGGGIGVITHWAKGRFDNVSLESRVSRPPSEL